MKKVIIAIIILLILLYLGLRSEKVQDFFDNRLRVNSTFNFQLRMRNGFAMAVLFWIPGLGLRWDKLRGID